MAMGACGEEDLSLSLSLSSSWPSLGPVNRSVWFIYRYLPWLFIPPLPSASCLSFPPLFLQLPGGRRWRGRGRDACMWTSWMAGQDRLDRLTDVDVTKHACRQMFVIQRA